MTIRRALLSVHDKTGLPALGHALAARGCALIASGGTATALQAAGLVVQTVESVTGFAELLGGRVKTLHPAIHGGILARATPPHAQELAERGIAPIDLVVCNLYPFARTVARPGVTEAEAIEQIDIGGVTLLRAAAKNFERVVVLGDPASYGAFVEGLARGGPSAEERRAWALAAFRQTAAYDAAIATWLAGPGQRDEAVLPDALRLAADRVQTLRYGENPHQAAALYQPVGEEPGFALLQGKSLSYNNLIDLDAAWAMPAEFARPAVAIVKHTSPCGLAVGEDLVQAFERALACDPLSAFGSIIACNRPVDLALIEAIGPLFVEAIAAPAFDDDALARLSAKKRNCRVVLPSPALHSAGAAWSLRGALGGLLVQTRDQRGLQPEDWKVVTRRQPTAAQAEDLRFGHLACKHVKSNAIVLARGGATVGIGGGQTSRVDAVHIAVNQAAALARGAVLASDAFFPFADGVEAAAEAGVVAIIQPGGSKRDDEVIAAADQAGLAMVMTGVRHFRHG